MLTENVITRVIYLGTRLSSKFKKIKDKTVKEHQHMSRKSVLRRLYIKNVMKVSKEYLTIMVQRVNLIW